MRKNIITNICTLILVLGIIGNSVITAEAAGFLSDAPPGYIQDGLTRGEMVKLTRGSYLQGGYSDLSKAGVGKVFVEGETVALQPVSDVRIHCAIQQWSDSTQTWSQYDYLATSNYNASYVRIRETVDVPRGFYYRVSSTHSAGGESGYSYSSGVWIG